MTAAADARVIAAQNAMLDKQAEIIATQRRLILALERLLARRAKTFDVVGRFAQRFEARPKRRKAVH